MAYMSYNFGLPMAPMGPTVDIIVDQMSDQVTQFPEHGNKIAAIRGAIVGATQGLNPNAIATFKIKVEADDTGMRLLLTLNAAGIAP